MDIEKLVVDLSKDPFNPKLNFKCAQEYDRLGQTASAVSFYLRTAEYGYESDKGIAYESLLRTSMCFDDQTDRKHTVTNCILQAVALDPERPEGYFLMSRYYERAAEWQECYTWANMGLTKKDTGMNYLLDYPGLLGLTFEKAVAGWWIGRKDESRRLFNALLIEGVPANYEQTIRWNLGLIGSDEQTTD
jgi:hypothetical protein